MSIRSVTSVRAVNTNRSAKAFARGFSFYLPSAMVMRGDGPVKGFTPNRLEVPGVRTMLAAGAQLPGEPAVVVTAST
jgi:hypothetical protein